MPSRHSPLVLIASSLLLLSACNTPSDAPVAETGESSSSLQSIDAASSSVPEEAPVSGVEFESPEWNRYASGMGFSMRIPRSIQPGFDQMPVSVNVIEDPRSNRVFVAAETWYDAEGDPHAVGLEDLTHESGPRVPSWEIVSKEVEDDDALEAFIQARYGKDCRLGEKRPTEQAGTFDVRIAGTVSPDEGDCFVNYITAIRYSPARKQVVAWNLGQDVTFVGAPATRGDQDRVYDVEMVESFRFE